MKTLLIAIAVLLISFDASARSGTMPFQFHIDGNVVTDSKELAARINAVLLSPTRAAQYGTPQYKCVIQISEIIVNGTTFTPQSELDCGGALSRQEMIDFLTGKLSEVSGVQLLPSVVSRN